jgi:hypothetical protein
MPRPFKPVGEWVNPEVQYHYDVAANRKSIFVEKRIIQHPTLESAGVISRFLIKNFKVFQGIWLVIILIVTVYALYITGTTSLIPLASLLLGYCVIVGTRLGMMALIHSYAFHMTDWRYVFPIALSICLLPFSLIGISNAKRPEA